MEMSVLFEEYRVGKHALSLLHWNPDGPEMAELVVIWDQLG